MVGAAEGLDVLKEHLKFFCCAIQWNLKKIAVAHTGQTSIEERCGVYGMNTPALKLLQEQRGALEESLREIAKVIGEKPRTKTLGDLRTNISATLPLLPDVDNDHAVLEHLSDMLLRADRQPLSLKNYKDVAPQLTDLQNTWAKAMEEALPDLEGEAYAMQAADHLACLLSPVYAEYLTLCREANRYDFLTLGKANAGPASVLPKTCSKLRDRYRYVMVDEFQDTNPLQWEILSYLVGGGPKGLLDRDRLCIVGDPQQSIFRFRQADVRVFKQVHDMIEDSNRHHGLADLPMDYDAEPGIARQRVKSAGSSVSRELSLAQSTSSVAHGRRVSAHL